MRRTALAALVVTLVAAGCSVSADDAPRDIEQAASDLDQGTSPSAQAAEGSGRIYLTATTGAGQATTLRSVSRDVGEDDIDAVIDAVVDALLAGPNATELAQGYRSALPAGLEVTSRQRRGTLVALDLSSQIQDLSGNALIVALAQIVYTLSEVSGVDRVLLTVDGVQPQWPDGRGQLRSDPLTVYDYPGLEPSAQPAYPAVPSQ